MNKTSSGRLICKRSIALLASAFLFAASGQAAFASDSHNYVDVPDGHWAASAIERLSGYELVNGYNGSFRPNASITRGEMAVIIDRTMKYHEKSSFQFSDLEQAFFTDAILRTAYTGVIEGDGETVRPLDNISRQEAVVMLARAFGISQVDGDTTFADQAAIAPWAKGYVKAMQDKSYVKGNDNKFHPTHEITRAEVAELLHSLIGELYSEADTYTNTINGNVIVNSPDVVLKDTLIKDDLIIAEGVADGDVTLENVTVKGKTIIRGGGDHSIHVTGNSQLSTVVVEKLDSAVRLSLSDQVKADTIAITGGAEGTKVEISQGAAVDMIRTQVKGTIINSQGTVKEMMIDADDVSISANNAIITVGKDQTGVTVNDKQVQGGSIIETNADSNSSGSGSDEIIGGSGSGSGSSNGGSATPAPTPTPEPIKIANVETVTNGRIKLTLNRATDTALTKDNISIICTSGGKDMTVLDVVTTDNKVYDVRTAYYDDNSYSLAIIQHDKVVDEFEFISKYDCPAITSAEAVRKDAETAEFTYVSDISGEFYYLIQKTQQTRSVWTDSEAPTAEQLMEVGTSAVMKNALNTILIDQLELDTPYTLYYVAKGIDNKVTPVKSIGIAAKATEGPAQGDISIVKIEAFDTKATSLLDVLGGFHFELSRPTEQTLTMDAFTITCPGDSNITLGRLETTDNQHYTMYMKEGYMFKDRNTYTVTITFPDQTVATEKFYVDLSAPLLTGVTIERTGADTARVVFNSNEAGFIYWMGLDKSQTSDTSFKDPAIIINGGQKTAILEGGNVLELTGIAPKNAVFGYVTEDELGNQPRTYYYDAIPDDITDPEPEPVEGLTIQDIQVSTESDGPNGLVPALDVTLDQEVMFVSSSDIIIEGNGVYITGYKYLSPSQSSDTPNQVKILVKRKLAPGTYTLKISYQGKTGTKDFIIS